MRSKLTLLGILLGLFGTLAGQVLGSKGAPGPISEETLPGIWEAISIQDFGFRVFRMDLAEGAKSFLAIAFVNDTSRILELNNVETRDGTLSLYFADEGNRSWGALEVRGRGSGQVGKLTGVLRLSLDAGPEQLWPVEFLRVGGSFIERICTASNQARNAIFEMRQRYPVSPSATPHGRSPLPAEKLRR
jgi:hypothetical protein